MLLENGSVTLIGPVKQVVENYLKGGLDHNPAQIRFPTDPHKPFQYMSAEILHAGGTAGSDFSCDEPVTIRLEVEMRKPTLGPVFTFALHNLDGIQVLYSDFRDSNESGTDRLAVGLHTFEITIPPRILAPTTYLLSLNAGIQFSGWLEHREACCEFTLRDFSTRLDIGERSCVLGLLLPWDHHTGLLDN